MALNPLVASCVSGFGFSSGRFSGGGADMAIRLYKRDALDRLLSNHHSFSAGRGIVSAVRDPVF